MRNIRSRGFSLIELSIVLVIIALLTGAILSIQTYLKSAELSTLMNESKYFINAFNQFQNRYQYPPGDLSTAGNIWSGAGNGDGNGLIRTNATCAATPATCSPNEIYLAFQHLNDAGFIDGNYTGAANAYGGATAGSNIARLAVQNTALYFDRPSVIDGNVSGDGVYFDGLYNHVAIVASVAANSASLPAIGFISPQNALKLDTKFDDGVPNKGWVMTGNPTISPNCTSGGLYSISYLADNACYFILRIQ